MNYSQAKFYVNRIRAMGFTEFMYRIKWKAYHNSIGILKQKKGLHLAKKLSLAEFKRSNKANFIVDKFSQEEIKSSYVTSFSLQELLRRADLIVDNKISIYELRNHDLGSSINWNKEYKHDKIWPHKYAPSFHHADPKYGQVRYVWELNRHDFLPILARAYYLTKDEKYAIKVFEIIESWQEQNPYLMTINWFSGLELGLRSINWVWTLMFCKNSEQLTQERFDAILETLYQHFDTITHNISLYSSANNHLTGELAGIVLLTTLFPHFRDAHKWQNKALKMLEHDTIDQIHKDGVGAEQTTNYLIFVLDLYLQSYIVAGHTIPTEVMNRLQKSAKFIHTLKYNKEQIPDIGDSDEAQVAGVLLDPTLHAKANSILNTILLLQEKNTKKIDEKTFWLFGPITSSKEDENQEIRTVPKSQLFKEGGWFISVSNSASLTMDCGPLGYLKPAGHGHCDALSILLSVDNKDFFIDPGTYVYHNDEKWRNYFRSTLAHNTLTVDNTNQSKISGDFIFSQKASVTIDSHQIDSDKDSIKAKHDGYKNKEVMHSREVIHDKSDKIIIINDLLWCTNKHDVAISFTLHQDVKITKENNILILQRENTTIKMSLPKICEISIHKGETNPIRGWHSLEFGVKLPTNQIIAKATVDKETTFSTTITYNHKNTN